MRTLRRLLPAAAAAVATLLVPVTSAQAAGPVGTLTEDLAGCIADAGELGCQNGRALSNGGRPVFSPDERFVYVPSLGARGVAVLTRDPVTGRLTQTTDATGCIATEPNVESPPCADGFNLGGASAVAVSADGRFAFVGTGAGVTSLARDASTGALSTIAPNGCITNTAHASEDPAADYECANGRNLEGSLAVAISPDGHHLYQGRAGGAGADRAVNILTVGADGSLSQAAGKAGCLRRAGNLGTIPGEDVLPGQPAGTTGCSTEEVPAMGFPTDLRFSADGLTLFMSTSIGSDSAVYSLRRDPADGSLSVISCINSDGTSGCVDGRGLGGSETLALSPDGKTLYSAGGAAPGIAVFDVAPDGTLSQSADDRGCFAETTTVTDGGALPCRVGRALGFGLGLAVSADGETLLSTSTAAGPVPQIAVLDRAEDGSLSQNAGTKGCVSSNATASGSPGTSCGLAMAPGGRFLLISSAGQHVYSSDGEFVNLLRREQPPTCSDAAGNVVNGVSASVAFSCVDPNGDPVSLTIGTGPGLGLASINAGTLSAFYTPPVDCRAAQGAGPQTFTVVPSDGINAGLPATGTATIESCGALPTPPITQNLPGGGGGSTTKKPAVSPTLTSTTLTPDKKNRFGFTLTCPKTAASACKGKLTITTAKVKLSAKAKAKAYKVLAVKFALEPGKSAAFAVKVNANSKKALKFGKGKVKAAALVQNEATTTATATTTTTAVALRNK